MAAVSIRLNPVGVILVLVLIGCMSFYWFGGTNLFRSEAKVSMKQLLCVSIDLAKRGGLRVKEIRDGHHINQKVKGLTREGAKELLTEGDLQSHRAIVYGFDKAFPGIKVISEEHERKPVDFKNIPDPVKQMKEVDDVINLDNDRLIPLSDVTVWVDPLDATKEYTEDLTKYVTTLVCVAVRGQPMIGVIHQPFLKKTAWGWIGYGYSPDLVVAKKDKETAKPKAPTKVIVSRSHAGSVKENIKDSFENEVKIISAGGAGFKTLAVINEEADVYVHTSLIKKWDICAGNALLHAVGGRMTTLDGSYIDYKEESEARLEKGLLASLKDHSTYEEKFKKVAEEIRKKLDNKTS